jgi:hypothetical protein
MLLQGTDFDAAHGGKPVKSRMLGANHQMSVIAQ